MRRTVSPMPLSDARLFHVNVNCLDLERSQRFYTEGLGLTAGVRTTPDTIQPGAAFGLDRALWDASILLGPNGYDGGAIDLLQWHEPAPVGAPPRTVNETGFQRLGVRVPDLDATVGRVTEPRRFGVERTVRVTRWRAGARSDSSWSAIRTAPRSNWSRAVRPPSRSWRSLAPISTDHARSTPRSGSVSWPSIPARTPTVRTCTSTDRSRWTRSCSPRPTRGEVLVMLVGFRTPAVERTPARAANALGMWRAAFLVTDLDAAVEELARNHVATISAPVSMSMGPGLPELRFVCFRGPSDEVLELIEQPAAS